MSFPRFYIADDGHDRQPHRRRSLPLHLLRPIIYAQPIYRSPPRQHCTALICTHSKWQKSHPEFVEFREYQSWSNSHMITNLIDRKRDRTAGLSPFQGFYRPQAGGKKLKQVAPSGYAAMAQTWGPDILDDMLCLCALDPSIPTHAARARVVDRTSEGGGWVLTCHRAPKVGPDGQYDYTNTCGMEMKIHYYRKNAPAILAHELPPHAIRLPPPPPPKPTTSGTGAAIPSASVPKTTVQSSGRKVARARSEDIPVIDLTESD